MNHCQNCCQSNEEKGSSSFVLGLVFGLIAAAIVAVLIYRHRQSDVVKNLKSKLEEVLNSYLGISKPAPAPKKSPVSKPKLIAKSFKSTPVPKPESKPISKAVKRPKTFKNTKR